MIKIGNIICPKCLGKLKFYDKVLRILKHKNRVCEWIFVRRLRCIKCKSTHRELTEDILPFKHYESEIIFGVIDNWIDVFTKGFEDYPCEMTMHRWKQADNSHNLQLL